jgi:hypothetical protein
MRKLLVIFVALILLPPATVWPQTSIMGTGHRKVMAGYSTKAFVQGCANGAAATPAASYSVSFPCFVTPHFTAGDGLILDYDLYTTPTADITTVMVSTIGATITWHKAGSGLYNGSLVYAGTLYACPSDITGYIPGTNLTVTVTPTNTSTYSGIVLTEVSGFLSAGCLDQWVTPASGSSSGATITSSTSSTLATISEYADATGSTGGPGLGLTGGTCFGTTCGGLDSPSCSCDFASMGFITTATTAGSMSFNESNTGHPYQVTMALFK